jgi:hypothetical protein
MKADGRLQLQDFDSLGQRLSRIHGNAEVLARVYRSQESADEAFGLALEGIAQQVLDASYQLEEIKEAIELTMTRLRPPRESR